MKAKEFKEVKLDSELQSFEDHHEITTVKDSRIMSDDVSCHNEKMAFISHSQKLNAPDCSHYLQTGFCAFGMNCKFNQPSEEENVKGTLEGTDLVQKRLETCKVGVLGNDASSEIVEQIECKFYLLPGGCKYGDDCIFLHHVQLNFLGLPIRPGEIECPFYITTGGCKFASRCRYHHPDPTVVIEETFFKEYNIEAPSQTSFFDSLSYYDPVLRTSNPDLHSNTEWNGNQSAKCPFRPQEMNINDQLKILANKDTLYEFRGGIGSQQLEGYPQRPCEPVCQFLMKIGFCKFKAACRYHHPKSKLSLESLSSNNLHHGFVKQLQVTPMPAENDKIQQTTFLATSASYAPILLTPNQGLKLNEQWIGNQIATSSFHSPETKLTEQWPEIANKNTAYEFRGTIDSQQVDEYPQRLNEPECQYFMKTGYCKFKSACKYHHPKSNLCIINRPPLPAISNHQYLEPVEQLCLTQCLSENTLNEQTTFQAPSTSFVERQDIPNQQIQPNDACIQNQVDTAPLHLQEKKLNDQGQELGNKFNAFKFNNGVDFQLSDEYPQRPDEPECQYFMKTGYCKFKSACRYHHPYSNLHIPGIMLKPLKNNYEMATGSLHVPEIKMNEHGREFANKCVISEFSDRLESQHLDEYPQKPSEPECQYFMKTGHCKFKSACRYHHPKSNFSHLESQIKSMPTNSLHLPEIKNDEQGQESGNNDAPYEFNDGGESQQPDEYPQRPSEPECQHFMKTAICMPISSPAIKSQHIEPPEKLNNKPVCTCYSRHGICKFGSSCK